MNIKDVENLAELARLELSAEEKKEILKDMEGILDYVRQIEEVKVPNMKVNYPLYNVWREDNNPNEPGKYSKELWLKRRRSC